MRKGNPFRCTETPNDSESVHVRNRFRGSEHDVSPRMQVDRGLRKQIDNLRMFLASKPAHVPSSLCTVLANRLSILDRCAFHTADRFSHDLLLPSNSLPYLDSSTISIGFFSLPGTEPSMIVLAGRA